MKISKLQTIYKKIIIHFLKNPTIIENYRPSWLYGMELDFYLPEYKLAIEIQGQQHFTPSMYFGESQFIPQVRRDHSKRALCKKKHIKLVVYSGHLLKSRSGINTVAKRLKKDSRLKVIVSKQKIKNYGYKLPYELEHEVNSYRRSINNIVLHKKIPKKIRLLPELRFLFPKTKPY